MAIRRHLLLAREHDLQILGSALSGLAASPLRVTGPWCWSMASVWSESHAAIRTRVELVRVPFLFFTTFDGDGWILASGSGEGFAEEVTHDFRKDWRARSKTAAANVRRIVALLRKVATSTDAKELEDVVSGRSIGPAEEESDLGDLPRLLDVLGARGILEIPTPPPEQKARAPQAKCLQSLLKGHGGRARSRVEGVSLAVADGGDLAALALFCDPDILIAMEARGEQLPMIRLEIPCKIIPGPGFVAVEADGGMGLKLNVISRSLALLAGSQGLAELTLVTGKPRGGGKDVSWHRYTGSVKGGRWHLSEATPAVDGTTLASALALVDGRRAIGAVSCQSEDEAAAVARRCQEGLYITPDKQPRRQGAELHPAEGTRLHVLMELFRLRFAGTWNSTAARKEEQKEARKWDALGRVGGGNGP